MEAQRDNEIDESSDSGQERMPLICHDSESEERRRLHERWLQELSESHVPTHDFKDDSEASDQRCRLSAEIASSGDSDGAAAENSVQQNDQVSNTSNLDLCAPRSSTQTTTSTSSASLSQNSDAWSMSMTVSSAPTSMSSRFSDISAIDILELEKGVFAAPKLPLDPKDQSAWDRIQPRLQDTIDNTLQTRRDLEPTISCEFMMGGPSPKQLRPTVFLVCCHEVYRKQLKATLKRQTWIREYGYQLVVIVGAFEELSFGSLGVTPGADSIRIQASFSYTNDSYCGMLVRARAREENESVRFTIGGILLIDNKAFGLTVGHVVEKLILPHYDLSDHDDEDDSDSSPFITFEEEDSVKMRGLSSSRERALASQLQDVADRGESTIGRKSNTIQRDGLRWSHFGHFNASTTSHRATASRNQLDWSLVSLCPELENDHGCLINSFGIPSGNHVTINKFLQRSALMGSEVWIKSGSTGVVRGWLMDSLVLFHQHGKTFQVLQVISDQPLGTSR